MDYRVLKLSTDKEPSEVAFVLNAREAHAYQYGERKEITEMKERLFAMGCDLLAMVNQSTGRKRVTVAIMDEQDRTLDRYQFDMGRPNPEREDPSEN